MLAPGIIASDYWSARALTPGTNGSGPPSPVADGLTSTTRLRADLERLESYELDTLRRTLVVERTISLATFFPVEFARFRQTGRLTFQTPIEWYDDEFPGHVMRRIRSVSLQTFAITPNSTSLQGHLTANGLSSVIMPSAGRPARRIGIETEPTRVAIAGGAYIDDPNAQDVRLRTPFAGRGVDTIWNIDIPLYSNPIDFDAIDDIYFTIEYEAFDDESHRQRVVAQLPVNFDLDTMLDAETDAPDAWFSVMSKCASDSDPLGPFTLTFAPMQLDSTFFRDGVGFSGLTELALIVASDDAGALDGATLSVEWKLATASESSYALVGLADRPIYDGVVSTRRGNLGDPSVLASITANVANEATDWRVSITVDSLAKLESLIEDENLEGLSLVFSYAGVRKGLNLIR